MKLSQFKILTFDVYGTLIDWESGMVNALKPLDRPGCRPPQPRRYPERPRPL